jgi:hypothetical protein
MHVQKLVKWKVIRNFYFLVCYRWLKFVWIVFHNLEVNFHLWTCVEVSRVKFNKSLSARKKVDEFFAVPFSIVESAANRKDQRSGNICDSFRYLLSIDDRVRFAVYLKKHTQCSRQLVKFKKVNLLSLEWNFKKYQYKSEFFNDT